MKFKTDENLPDEVADVLRRAGHDVSTVIGQHMQGEPDPTIASVCQREQRAVVTFDVGFADIRRYPPEEYFGLVVLRLRRQDKISVIEVVERLLPMLDQEPLEGTLWIVEEQRVRIRT